MIWTPADDEVLRLRYVADGAAAVSASTGRTLQAVYGRARVLGIQFFTPSSVSEADRFWAKVTKGDGCWIYRNEAKSGRGMFWRRSLGITQQATHVAWELTRGPIPEGMFACHACDNPPCVRPEPGHLFLGDAMANMRDKIAKGRGAHGTAIHTSKLNESLVVEIRVARTNGAKLTELSAKYGVSIAVLSKLCRGEAWRHVPMDLGDPKSEWRVVG